MSSVFTITTYSNLWIRCGQHKPIPHQSCDKAVATNRVPFEKKFAKIEVKLFCYTH